MNVDLRFSTTRFKLQNIEFFLSKDAIFLNLVWLIRSSNLAFLQTYETINLISSISMQKPCVQKSPIQLLCMGAFNISCVNDFLCKLALFSNLNNIKYWMCSLKYRLKLYLKGRKWMCKQLCKDCFAAICFFV